MTKADQKFLFKLLETPSPTGWEMPGQRVWADYVKGFADKVECDTYGSTWATINGTSKNVLMLESHADEIGFIIKHVEKDGFLRLDRVGGSDVATARGRRLRILGDKGDITGIIGNTAIHLRRDSLSNEKALQTHELWVDVGASNPIEVAALGLRVGHPAVYLDGPMELGKDLLVSRALDNRIGGYIIAQAMKIVASAAKKPAWTLVCLNAVQEEIGGFGAKMATNRIHPDACVCLDVTHATDTPGLSAAKTGEIKLGEGPTLTTERPIILLWWSACRRWLTKAKSRFSMRRSVVSPERIPIKSTMFIVVFPRRWFLFPMRCMHSVVETAHQSRYLTETIELAGQIFC